MRIVRERRVFGAGVLCVVSLSAACAHQPAPVSTTPGVVDSASTSTRSTAERTRTTSTQTANADDLNQSRYTSIEQMIEGRFSGVQVIHLDKGGYSLRIRGTSSFQGSSEPLFVLDGVPLASTPAGALSGLDPRDIDRIDVLKDAAATSAYGSRGANGVILIKTKRARRPNQ